MLSMRQLPETDLPQNRNEAEIIVIFMMIIMVIINCLTSPIFFLDLLQRPLPHSRGVE